MAFGLTDPPRYQWPDVHLDYMAARMFDHSQRGFGIFIRLFKWARANRENPGCKSTTLFPPSSSNLLTVTRLDSVLVAHPAVRKSPFAQSESYTDSSRQHWSDSLLPHGFDHVGRREGDLVELSVPSLAVARQG